MTPFIVKYYASCPEGKLDKSKPLACKYYLIMYLKLSVTIQESQWYETEDVARRLMRALTSSAFSKRLIDVCGIKYETYKPVKLLCSCRLLNTLHLIPLDVCFFFFLKK